MQPFQGRLFQQNQRVAHIVAVRLGVRRENLLDAGCQSNRPAAGLRRAGCGMAWSHVDAGRLPADWRIVTAVPEHFLRRAADVEVFHRRDATIRAGSAASLRCVMVVT